MPTISGVITLSNFVSMLFFYYFEYSGSIEKWLYLDQQWNVLSWMFLSLSDHSWPPQIRLPLLTHHPDLRVGDLRLHVLQLLLEGAGTPSPRPGSQEHPHDHFHPGRNGKTGWFKCISVWGQPVFDHLIIFFNVIEVFRKCHYTSIEFLGFQSAV